MTTKAQGQTDANRTGRLRLREGVLTPSPATIAITPDLELDPEAFDFIYQPDFLSPAECALLAETAEALRTASILPRNSWAGFRWSARDFPPSA